MRHITLTTVLLLVALALMLLPDIQQRIDERVHVGRFVYYGIQPAHVEGISPTHVTLRLDDGKSITITRNVYGMISDHTDRLIESGSRP